MDPPGDEYVGDPGNEDDDDDLSPSEVVDKHRDKLPGDRMWPQVVEPDPEAGAHYNPHKYRWIVENVIEGDYDPGPSPPDIPAAELVDRHSDDLPDDRMWTQPAERDSEGNYYHPGKHEWILNNVY